MGVFCLEGSIPDTEGNAALVLLRLEQHWGSEGLVKMVAMMKMIFLIVKMLFKICWKIVKYLSGPMCDSTKDVWKICKGLYKSHEKNVDTVASSKSAKDAASIVPDESVCVSVKDEFENLTDEDLNLLLQKMTDLAVEVDLRPELEEVYETYGVDQETFKQEIIDELKRRRTSR